MGNNNKTILLVGGGTGGHAAPLLAVYEKIQELSPETKVVAVGVGTKEEREFLRNIPDYKTICAGKLNRYLTLRNISEGLKFIYGTIQSVFLLRRIKPKVVFAKGGYVSLPVVFAARALKIPYYTHESDIEMGSTNKLIAKRAKSIFVNYPVDFYKDKNKLIFSGPLLRKGFFGKDDKEFNFGFSSNKPVILITGGSQGSLNITKNFISIAQELLNDFCVIHQAGKHSESMANEFKKTLSPSIQSDYFVTSFLEVTGSQDKMLDAINSSDIVISRASSTISELAVKGKPMILIPWKHAAQKHQLKNAIYLKEQGAADYITEDELTPELLKEEIYKLFNNKSKLRDMSFNAKRIFPNNGVEIVSKKLLKEVE